MVYYNLDVILSVGCRVDSKTATEFRKWATKVLKQHITKGYSINKKVLKRNYEEFLKVVDDIKLLSGKNKKISKNEVLDKFKKKVSDDFNPTENSFDEKFPLLQNLIDEIHNKFK